MNTVLSYIAGLLVLLLFAALVGPSIVDWNSFRGEIEAQISNAMGRPVAIDGDINFVILPAPRFSLQGLSIESLRGGDPLAEFGTLEGEVALAPLLRGEVVVTRIRALNFTARLLRDGDGNLNWVDDEEANFAAALDLDTISLEAAHFEQGSIIYSDVETGHEFELTNVVGELRATSLLGPLRFDGFFDLAEQPYEISASVGVFGGDRAFPVNFDLQAPNSSWRASFTGLATGVTADARLDGSVQFSFGKSEVSPGDEDVAPVVSLQAGAVINRNAATLRDVELALVGSVLKGQLSLAYDTVPTLTAEFSGARLLVGQLLRDIEQLDIPFPALQIPEQLVGTIDVQVTDLAFDALHAENATSHLEIDQGILKVVSFRSEFPGQTEVLATGTVDFSQEEPRFDGVMEATVADFPAFGRWIENTFSPHAETTTPLPVHTNRPGAAGDITRLHLQTELALRSSLWQAYSLVAVFADGNGDLAPMTGGVSFARRARPALGIELEGPLLNLNFLTPFLLPSSLDDLPDFSAFDANIVVSVDRFQLRDWSLTDLELTAALNEGHLSIDTFEAAANETDVGASHHLSFSGSLENIGQYPVGGIEGSASAALLAEWAGTFGGSFLKAHDGDLSFILRGERAEERHLLALDMSGTVDGSEASLVFKQERDMADERLLQTNLLISLDNANAGELTHQIGLGRGVDGIEGEGAALLVQLSGAGDGPFDANVRLRADETTFSMTGKVGSTTDKAENSVFSSPRFYGRFEASSDRFESIAAVAGWRGALVDLISANGRGGAVIAGGGLEWTLEQFALSELEAVAGTFRVSGQGSYLGADGPAKIDATIELGHISLDPLFLTEDGSAWDARPLAWQALSDFEGNIRVSASSVAVAGLVFSQVDANASLADGVLSFTPVTAQFADGRLTMGGRFEGGEGVPGLGLTVALEDADIGKVSSMLFDTPLGAGKVTASLQLEGRGRSLLGLVSALSGRGTLALGEGNLSGFDLPTFRVGLDELEDMDGFEALVAQTLRQGMTDFDEIEGPIQVADGVLRFVPTVSEITGTTEVQVNALVDLVRLEMDVESEITLAGDIPLPPLTMVLGGTLHDLDRRTDTLALQSAIARAILVREMEEAGVEELPEELRELIEPYVPGGNLDAPLEGVDVPPQQNATPVPANRPPH